MIDTGVQLNHPVLRGSLTAGYDFVDGNFLPNDTANGLDDDGDGLNNSWEKSLGADPNNPDSDGDGMSDGDEHRAGTGATDSNSTSVITTIFPSFVS